MLWKHIAHDTGLVKSGLRFLLWNCDVKGTCYFSIDQRFSIPVLGGRTEHRGVSGVPPFCHHQTPICGWFNEEEVMESFGSGVLKLRYISNMQGRTGGLEWRNATIKVKQLYIKLHVLWVGCHWGSCVLNSFGKVVPLRVQYYFQFISAVHFLQNWELD